MTMHPFNLKNVDPSWEVCLQQALTRVDPGYLNQLSMETDWLPGPKKIFNAFSLPLEQVNYVLFGESPYPRKESANGFAFWDANVTDLWSPSGLSTRVNRATSLRNIIKMLLIAEGLLDASNTSQPMIAHLDKALLIKSCNEFFANLINNGFLLLNATPVLRTGPPHKDAKAWHPFTEFVLNYLLTKKPSVKFILLGQIANKLEQFIQHHPSLEKLYAEHPYNISFITNPKILDFFKPFHLLLAKKT